VVTVRRTLVAGTALLLVATGCGGGGKVGPEEYVASVCTEVGGWVEEVQARSDRLGKDVASVTANDTRRDLLAEYFDDLIALTDDHLAGMRNAGVPDVDAGQAIADAFVGVFEDAKVALQDARGKVDELPTDDPAAFAAAAGELGNSIESALTEVGGSIEGLDSPELTAAAQDQDCPALTG
jgi:hypothetical protein